MRMDSFCPLWASNCQLLLWTTIWPCRVFINMFTDIDFIPAREYCQLSLPIFSCLALGLCMVCGGLGGVRPSWLRFSCKQGCYMSWLPRFKIHFFSKVSMCRSLSLAVPGIRLAAAEIFLLMLLAMSSTRMGRTTESSRKLTDVQK